MGSDKGLWLEETLAWGVAGGGTWRGVDGRGEREGRAGVAGEGAAGDGGISGIRGGITGAGVVVVLCGMGGKWMAVLGGGW